MKSKRIFHACLIVLCLLLTTSCSHKPETEIVGSPILEELAQQRERLTKLEKDWYEAVNEVIALRLELERKRAEYESPPSPVQIVEVEVEKRIVVHEEIIVNLTDWADESELKAFLASDNTDTMIILKANKEGIVTFNNQCEDRALQLINNAMNQGKRLSFVPLHRAEYLKWYNEEIEEGHYHAIAGALVGDNFWYIEPGDDRCWLALYLD